MANNCKIELSDNTIPLKTGCFGVDEYVLLGDVIGGWGSGKYAKRKLSEIITCTSPFVITSADFEDNGVDYIDPLFSLYQVEIFYNSINRFLNLADDEWEYLFNGDGVQKGIKVLIAGFDANTDNKRLILFPKKFYTVPICGVIEFANISDTSVEVISEIKISGNKDVTKNGFVYSENPNPKVEVDNTIEVGDGIGFIQDIINNLEPNTTYYIRSFAENSIGIGYGDFIQFTTQS